MDAAALRPDFPALSQSVYGRPLIYLDNAATTQVPQAVIQAMSDYLAHSHANVHRSVYALSEAATAQYEASRDTVAAFLHARREEIVFTGGTTDAIHLVSRSVEAFIGPKDAVLVTQMEHHSNYLPWLDLCRRRGAQLRCVPLTDSGELDLAQAEALLADGRVRLMAVCHVSNVTGVRNDVSALAALAHRWGALLLVDGAQGVRHEAVDVSALGCDFYCFSAHKLFGPTGIGVLWIAPKLLEQLSPPRLGGGMIRALESSRMVFEDAPLRFEAGTPNLVGAVGFKAALDYLSAHDPAALRAREQALTARLEQRLTTVEGVSLLGSPAARFGTVSFICDGAAPYDLAILLDKLGVAVRSGHHCAIAQMEQLGVESALRASPAFYNTEDEIDRFIYCLEQVLRVLRG